MTFKRTTLRYGETPEPVTPYQKAAQVWDERIGSARAQAHNWRLMALGSLVLALLLAALLLWIGRSASTIPYIVEVDPKGGARAVGPAVETYKPSDAQIAFHLARYRARPLHRRRASHPDGSRPRRERTPARRSRRAPAPGRRLDGGVPRRTLCLSMAAQFALLLDIPVSSRLLFAFTAVAGATPVLGFGRAGSVWQDSGPVQWHDQVATQPSPARNPSAPPDTPRCQCP